MRILVADQNALMLAAIASAFGRHCVVVTATRRDTCLEHLSQERFDVVVACEKLHGYTGLELLSEVETLAPQTLCIFSAPAARLAQLQSRLDHFRLLGTLSYPIDPRKLLMALKVARAKKLPSQAAPPQVRHVVLESEWDTGERLGILERELEVAPAEPPTLSAAPQTNIPVAPIPTAVPARKPDRTPVAGAGVDSDDIPILENVGATSVSPVRWTNPSPAAAGPLPAQVSAAPTRATAAPAQTTPAPARVAGAPNSRRAQKPAQPPTARADARQAASARQPELIGDADAEETTETSFDVMAASLGAPANDPSVEPPPPPPPPPVDTGGAANEPEFDFGKAEKNAAQTTAGKSAQNESEPQKTSAGKSGTGNAGSKTDSGDGGAKAQSPAGAAGKRSASPTKKTAPAGPSPRKQAVPTSAQREAFKRAQARRHAAQNGFSIEPDTNSPPSLSAGSAPSTPNPFSSSWRGAQSLTDLARMATTKRPLSQGQARFAPKRNVVMVGSGVAAVVLASVLAFQLTRSHAPTHPNRQAAAQLFGPHEAPQNSVSSPPPEVFGPPPGQTQQMAATAAPTPELPQPQSLDPNAAPSDPPPALEHPGPMMMQRSMDNSEPPPMQGNTDSE